MKNAIYLLLCGALIAAGCSKESAKSPPSPAASTESAASSSTDSPMLSAHGHGGSVSSAGGLSWTVPPSWKPGLVKPMRLATYLAADDTECGVFFFGPGQGGGDEDNISRWIGQFTEPDGSPAKNPTRETKKYGDVEVIRLDLIGAYLNPTGPTMAPGETKQNSRMLAAIVKGPQGNRVFFKLIGPKETVAKESSNFEALLKSLKKSQ